MRKLAPLALIAPVVAGCQRADTSWMPLSAKASWKVQVRAGLRSSVSDLKVTTRDAVAGVSGWRLSGPGGDSRLAWKNGDLVADQLSGTRFLPPLPMLRPNLAEKAKVEWSGMIQTAHMSFPAKAVLTQAPDELTISGRKETAICATLDVAVRGKTTSIATWYVRGIGIARQEEHQDGELLRAMDYVLGP